MSNNAPTWCRSSAPEGMVIRRAWPRRAACWGLALVSLLLAAIAGCRRAEQAPSPFVTCPSKYPECIGAEPPPMPNWRIPTEPQERAVYDYAHSLPLPAGMPEPVPFDFKAARMLEVAGGKSVGQQYFEHLCRTEDVEVIAKRVRDVDGFELLRPRGKTEFTPADGDRYGVEEPVGFGWFSDDLEFEARPIDWLGSRYVQPFYGVYQYVEFVSPEDPAMVVRVRRASAPDLKHYPHGVSDGWSSPNHASISAPYLIERIRTNAVDSKYAYVWRGIRRPRDREFGIGGGEFLVVDRQTDEVLAVKRTFKSTYVPRRPEFTRWSAARDCRNLIHFPPLPKFIMKVLNPNIHVNDAFLQADDLDSYHSKLRSEMEKVYGN